MNIAILTGLRTLRAITTRALAGIALGAPLRAVVRGAATDARGYARIGRTPAPVGPVDAAHGGGRGVRE